jgi:NAD(P)-dependent dehydrogenase (short-subunit alcohol dehydrogenase family)
MHVDDGVALITGGASGLGRATAELLASRGMTVVVVDLPSARERVPESSGLIFAEADVRDADAMEAAAERAAGEGPLRVCVTCAGTDDPGRIVRKGVAIELERFRRIVDINLVGTFNAWRVAAARMQANDPVDGDRGVLIGTASVAAFEGQIGQASYSASKAGIAGMTLPVARDLSSSLIRVVTIAPGLFDTPLLGSLPDDVRASLGESVPHPARFGSPDEYAALALHIIENSMLNGETIRLDGALRMAPR